MRKGLKDRGLRESVGSQSALRLRLPGPSLNMLTAIASFITFTLELEKQSGSSCMKYILVIVDLVRSDNDS